MPFVLPNHPPLVGFVAWTPERTSVVRDARGAQWLIDATASTPKRKPSATKPSARKSKSIAAAIPSNLSPELRAQIAAALSRMK